MTAALDNPGAFVGRFQPLHSDHAAMLLRIVNLHSHVFVGIANPDPSTHLSTDAAPHRGTDHANPYSYWQRSRMVHAVLAAEDVGPDRFTVVPFPVHHPDRWQFYIPPEATQHVRVFSQWEQDKVRLLEQQYAVKVWTNETRGAEGSVIRAALEAGQSVASFMHPAALHLIAP